MKKIYFLLFGLILTLPLCAQNLDSLFYNRPPKHKHASRFFLFITDTTTQPENPISFIVLNNIWNNPGYTGFAKRHTINLNSEAAMPLIDDVLYVPMKFSLSYDVSVGKKKRTGLGLYAAQSYFSVENWIDLMFSFSKEFVIKKTNRLRLAITLGYSVRSLNWDMMSFGDQIDPRYGFQRYTQETRPSELTNGFVDFNSGVFYSRKNFFFGASIQHLTQPQMGFFTCSKYPMNFMINTGYRIKITKDIFLTPSAEMFKTYPYYNYYSLALIGTYKEKFLLGFDYKYFSSFNTIAGINLWKKMMITATCGFPTDKIIYSISPISYLQLGIRYQPGKEKQEIIK